MDDLSEARTKLNEALDLRTRLGDKVGADITRSNLRLVPLALSTVLAVVLVLVALGGLAVLPFLPEPGDVKGVLDIEPEIVIVGELAAQPLKVTNVARVEVRLDELEDLGAERVKGCVDYIIGPEEECTFNLVLETSILEGLETRELALTTEEVRGDRRIIAVAPAGSDGD